MLVVIGLMSTMLAIGGGAWFMSSRRYREQGAAAQVEVVIRQARNNALFSGAPSFVEFDTQKTPPRLVPWGYRLAAMYHFEETDKETFGGRGMRAFVNNCLSTEGKIGRGLATGYLRNTQPMKGYVECLPSPEYDCEDGGLLEAYVFVEYAGSGQAQYVFHKPDCYALFMNGTGHLAGRAGSATIEAPNFLIPMRRWTKVGMAWDKSSIRLMVEDAIVAVAEGDDTPINSHPLFIGDPGWPVLGRIDEAKVLAAVRGQPFLLPGESKLVHNAAPWSAAFFTPDGSLDLRYHPGPIAVELILEGKRHATQISMLGQTKRMEVERVKTQAELDAEAAPLAAPPPKPFTLLPPRNLVPFKLPPLPKPNQTKPDASKPEEPKADTPKAETPTEKPTPTEPLKGGEAPEKPVETPAGANTGGGAQ